MATAVDTVAGSILTAAADLSDDDIRGLDFLLPSGMLDRSMELVDKAKVLRLVGEPSGQCLHIVRSMAAKRRGPDAVGEAAYVCTPGNCTCPAFCARAADSSDGRLVLCKHLLASMLAEITGAVAIKRGDDASVVMRALGLLQPLLPTAPVLSATAPAGFSAYSRAVETPATMGDRGPWPAGVSQLPEHG